MVTKMFAYTRNRIMRARYFAIPAKDAIDSPCVKTLILERETLSLRAMLRRALPGSSRNTASISDRRVLQLASAEEKQKPAEKMSREVTLSTFLSNRICRFAKLELLIVCSIFSVGTSWGDQPTGWESADEVLPLADSAKKFKPSCIEAAAGIDLNDPEFNKDDLLVTWQDNPTLNKDLTVKKHGALNIAPIDRKSGKFVMSKRQKLKDAKPVRINLTNNGPEWGFSQRGGEVFYTAYSADDSSTRLGKIKKDVNGKWQVVFLDDSEQKTRPEPSKNRLDNEPKIYYSSIIGKFGSKIDKGPFGWRTDTAAPSDEWLSDDAGTGRWMPDSSKLFHHVNIDEHSDLISVYDTATGIDTPIQPEPAWYIGLAAWSAPELGGKPALLANFENEEEQRIDLLVWRQDANGNWVIWTKIQSIDPEFPDIDSPEPFVYKGRSYVLLTSRTQISGNLDTKSFVWIQSIDPSLPIAEQVTRVVSQELIPGKVSAKADPEVVTLPDAGVRVYYVDKSDRGKHLLLCDGGM